MQSDIKTKKPIKNTPKPSRGKCLPLRGFYGVGMLFVIASIAFTSFLVLTGSNNKIFWLLAAPQIIFATLVLIYLSYNK